MHECLTENAIHVGEVSRDVTAFCSASLHSQEEGCVVKRIHSGSRSQSTAMKKKDQPAAKAWSKNLRHVNGA